MINNKISKYNNELAILVLSCDKYSDLWKPFFFQFWKCWPNCPYKIYLGSNTKKYEDIKIHTILSGQDRDWSSSLLKILNKIDSEYIFLWLDDFFPVSKIDSQSFSQALVFMKSYKAKHVNISPLPCPDFIMENRMYGEYEKGAPYRVSVFGFWEKETLKTLLIPGENPWNFEIMGSYRSSYIDGFYCVINPLFRIMNVVEKGKIFKEAYDYCISHSIPLSSDSRSVLANTYHLKSEIQKYYFNTVIRISWKIRLSIMNVLRKLLISY